MLWEHDKREKESEKRIKEQMKNTQLSETH